jgi:hypothetical protein
LQYWRVPDPDFILIVLSTSIAEKVHIFYRINCFIIFPKVKREVLSHCCSWKLLFITEWQVHLFQRCLPRIIKFSFHCIIKITPTFKLIYLRILQETYIYFLNKNFTYLTLAKMCPTFPCVESLIPSVVL